MSEFGHRFQAFNSIKDLPIAASATVIAVISLSSIKRVNFFAKAVFAAPGAAGGIKITEVYGMDLGWEVIGGNKSIPVNPLFDNVTAPVERGIVLPPSGTTGVLQWNFDCAKSPNLIQFTLENLDAINCVFNLYGDVD